MLYQQSVIKDPYNNPSLKQPLTYESYMSNSYMNPYHGYSATPGDPYHRK